MGKDIVAGALFLLTFVSPTPTPQAINSQLKHEELYMYSVKDSDTLGTIAQDKYGSSDYWVSIWNDNSWIENPDIIEKGWKLEIRNVKPDKSTLNQDLAKKLFGNEKSKLSQVSNLPQLTTAISVNAPSSLTDAQINFLGNCESGMSPTRNSGNGYYGAFQFSYGTWKSMGTSYERADLAPLEVQIDAVQRLVQRSSIFTQFPGCSARMRQMGVI